MVIQCTQDTPIYTEQSLRDSQALDLAGCRLCGAVSIGIGQSGFVRVRHAPLQHGVAW